MDALNVEIKARCKNISHIREILLGEKAKFIGLDHQVDTYYSVPNGRLKLRQGKIENALIHYQRDNIQGPKQSQVKFYRLSKADELNDILQHALAILTVVDKKREIYFIGNVKFHLDQVKGLGNFVEIEAIDDSGVYTAQELQQQCTGYMEKFNIQQQDLISTSYSDMLPGSGAV
jgi:predicted adenylyl cyclase CyaB